MNQDRSLSIKQVMCLAYATASFKQLLRLVGYAYPHIIIRFQETQVVANLSCLMMHVDNHIVDARIEEAFKNDLKQRLVPYRHQSLGDNIG